MFQNNIVYKCLNKSYKSFSLGFVHSQLCYPQERSEACKKIESLVATTAVLRLVEEDCLSVDKTMSHRLKKSMEDFIIVAEIATTHTRCVWGVEASLVRDKCMSNRLVLSVSTHPMDMGGLEVGLLGGKDMSNRPLKSMAAGTMAK